MAKDLSDYRDLVQRALGNRQLEAVSLDEWINFGMLDLAGAVTFAALMGEQAVTAVTSDPNLAVPAGTMSIILVKDTTNDKMLGKISPVEYYRIQTTTVGLPARWAWIGTNVKLHPEPSATNSYILLTESAPTDLSNDSDKTPFPAVWDRAVYLLAVHHALIDLSQEQRAAAWLSRAVSYIQSRLTEQDLEPKAGLQGMIDKINTLQQGQR